MNLVQERDKPLLRKATSKVSSIPRHSGRRIKLATKMGKRKQTFFVQILFFNYSVHSILSCISFRYTAQWFDTHILSKVFPQIFPRSHVAPHRVIAILLTIFPMLYFTSCDYFITTNLYFLIPSHLSPAP